MEETLKNVTDIDQIPAYKILKENFSDEILSVNYNLGELTITLRKNKILEICKFLHDNKELSYDFLTDLCGVDYFPHAPRFGVVYHLYSFKNNNRLRLKVYIDIEELTVNSVESVWKTANWFEREAFDMFGIKFIGHPFLRRILMPDDWEGHPLRKDYPLKGY